MPDTDDLTKLQTTEVLLENCAVWWICPCCEWAIAGLELQQMKVDEECPGCGCFDLSEFVPIAKEVINV